MGTVQGIYTKFYRHNNVLALKILTAYHFFFYLCSSDMNIKAYGLQTLNLRLAFNRAERIFFYFIDRLKTAFCCSPVLTSFESVSL